MAVFFNIPIAFKQTSVIFVAIKAVFEVLHCSIEIVCCIQNGINVFKVQHQLQWSAIEEFIHVANQSVSDKSKVFTIGLFFQPHQIVQSVICVHNVSDASLNVTVVQLSQILMQCSPHGLESIVFNDDSLVTGLIVDHALNSRHLLIQFASVVNEIHDSASTGWIQFQFFKQVSDRAVQHCKLFKNLASIKLRIKLE